MSVRVSWDVEPEESLSTGIEAAVEAALRTGGRPGLRVDVIVVADDTLANIHGRFLDDDSKTDVIAFDLGGEDEGPQAEIYLSIDRARHVSTTRGVSLERELALYAIHGALHLCGHDDHEEEDRRQMREVESSLMHELGHSPDHAPFDLGT